MEPPGLRRAAGCPGMWHSLGAQPVCWEPAERPAEHAAEQTSLLEPPRSAWLCPGLRLKCQGQERGLVGTGGTDGPWGCPGRSLRPSGWLPCCAADLGPEGVPWVSSPAGPSCSLHGLPRRPLLACRQRVAGPRPRGQDIPSEVMMPIT